MKRPKKRAQQNAGPIAILVLGAIGLVSLFGYGIYKSGSTPAATMDKEPTAGCTHSPVKATIAGLESVACKSADHVREGQSVTYESDPPLAGQHWASWVGPGFYQADQPKEKLVHSLEHGHVVIYYDESKLSALHLDNLKKLAGQYKGQWDGVVAVPRKDAKHAVILTAWEYALRLESWDQSRLDAFVDAFRGRGPENPVRPLS
ncbi:MAG TPA: DUF3105 domain-containing protein [Symbiobacteriaceae bacterium]|nr:DUF3105 domain-containing protein [Symbiobacteriaceae bacterium]